LRPRLYFPAGRDEFDKTFPVDDAGNLEPKARKLFQSMCSGYISYFRGGNPNAYPRKKVVYMNHIMSGAQATAYDVVFKDEKSQQDAKRGNRFFDQKEKEPITVFSASRCISNIAFGGETPDSVKNGTIAEKEDQYKHFLNIVNGDVKVIKGKPLEGQSGLEYIKGMHSVKLATIAEMVRDSPGTSFVYSNYRYRGGDVVALLLNRFCGFSEYGKMGVGSKYYLWNGDADPDVSNRAKDVFNSDDNKNGDLIKVIIGSPSTMEGIDFKNVRNVHIVDPWWNFSRIEQITARAIRFCSHIKSDYKMVNIFYHTASSPTPKIDSIDEIMYTTARKKMVANHDFYKCIKEVAIDCEINKYGNLIIDDAVFRSVPGSNGDFSLTFESGVVAKPTTVIVNLQGIYNIAPEYPKVRLEKIGCSTDMNYPYLEVPDTIRINTLKSSMLKELVRMDTKLLKKSLLKFINQHVSIKTKDEVRAEITKIEKNVSIKIKDQENINLIQDTIKRAKRSDDLVELNGFLNQLKAYIKKYKQDK
jgi:hypothetical protein